MSFRAGQKVVCINDAHARQYLRKGQIYVVRSPVGERGLSGFILINNGGGWNDGGWLPSRFEAVPESTTDISIFTAMLYPQSAKVDA